MSIVRSLNVREIRFPTSLSLDGSDAVECGLVAPSGERWANEGLSNVILSLQHSDPDYSCAYVEIITDKRVRGHGFTFTLGRGTEIVVAAVRSMSPMVVGQQLDQIFNDFGNFSHRLTNDTQMRWIGPEKGVVHLAAAAILNSLWDLWAKLESKPLWKLLSDMQPEKLVSVIDFTYITDLLTKDQALEILRRSETSKEKREKEILSSGYPAYTTNCGWIGYPTEKVQHLCKKYLDLGFTSFKIKVGQNLEDDRRRCEAVRQVIGWKNNLMVDANQKWDVNVAIEWMTNLSEFKPLWIEEPTSPDDILGHVAIAEALNPLGIFVATGEQCHNRVMFKQFLSSKGMQFCQIDACRLGGVNEALAVLLMAAKLNVPVCPHAGGVGLCELVQHLMFFDYISITGSTENRMIEYVDHLHEHFENPAIVSSARYVAPRAPGFSSSMLDESLADYEYPNGTKWKEMFATGIYLSNSSEQR